MRYKGSLGAQQRRCSMRSFRARAKVERMKLIVDSHHGTLRAHGRSSSGLSKPASRGVDT